MKNFIKKNWKKVVIAGVVILSVGVASSFFYNSQVAKADVTEIKLTEKDVIKIFNKEYPNKKVQDIELDQAFKGYVYQVTGYDTNSEYELKVDAKTGKVKKERTEKLKSDDRFETFELAFDKVIPRDEATKIAEKEATGGVAKEWKLEQQSNETAIWEVTVQDGRAEMQITLNAITGEVLEFDNED
ncbi:hypothetical protein X560_2585 [Listeria fleischmannii 1991]|uniref:Peptidase propeptide and YPEB domain n=2 Tax=Listeria fleischmannii TaxID=1069827 RepID=A0A2X3HCU3_9LIST|nr:PepSY domain-containing protein [Listeria fleischmannii]EMG27405.1 hypothetical protein LFLEISCH_11308 [Listeria fleischmannii subsp. fleischmannii LU2006-1]KMT57887.1 hypothetical protein X560_2585 [Listeria fleischmannii 1991]SQC68465.1 Peptidase propeptide and YPEB domain [Listeria fleischmannii subsp. fleischmannii]